MRTTEERIRFLHERAANLRRQREKRLIKTLGGLSACLCVCLTVCVVRLTGMAHSAGADGFTGSSLLSESAGGYVLVAVVSFALAVLVTVLCLKNRNRDGK